MDKDAYERFVDDNFSELIDGFIGEREEEFEEFCMKEFSQQAQDEED